MINIPKALDTDMEKILKLVIEGVVGYNCTTDNSGTLYSYLNNEDEGE